MKDLKQHTDLLKTVYFSERSFDGFNYSSESIILAIDPDGVASPIKGEVCKIHMENTSVMMIFM
jgi:hypothetical protein